MSLSRLYRKMHFFGPGSPHYSRISGSGKGAPVNAEKGWTERRRRDTTAAPQTCDSLNSVRSHDCSTRWGLERLQADFCRALGRIQTHPSALPDVVSTYTKIFLYPTLEFAQCRMLWDDDLLRHGARHKNGLRAASPETGVQRRCDSSKG